MILTTSFFLSARLSRYFSNKKSATLSFCSTTYPEYLSVFCYFESLSSECVANHDPDRLMFLSAERIWTIHICVWHCVPNRQSNIWGPKLPKYRRRHVCPSNLFINWFNGSMDYSE